MRFTVKAKLASAFGLIIAMSLVAGGVALNSLANLTDSIDTIARGSTQRIQLAGDMAGAFLNTHHFVQR